MRKMFGFGIMSLAVAVVLGAAALQADDKKADPVTDEAFATKAAIGGLFEVKSSELALKQAKGDKVKDFARDMVRDHTKGNMELMKIAADQKITLPAKLDNKHQKMLDDLEKARDNFDQLYTDTQVKAHDEAVMLFDNESKNGKNAALKEWATKTLPTLKKHREHIYDIAGKKLDGKDK